MAPPIVTRPLYRDAAGAASSRRRMKPAASSIDCRALGVFIRS